jgi:agmatinase
MTDTSPESDRLNLPFVGLSTFGKSPICLDWDAIHADVAVLGVPNDMGTQYRPGSRMGPRAIREASTLYSFKERGGYVHEEHTSYLSTRDVRIVDVGDVDIIHTDLMRTNANTVAAVRKILRSGALPVVLGGDHAITAPVIEGFDEFGPLHLVQFDAHLDFVDEIFGIRHGHGSPIRRASETGHVTGLTQLGVRNLSSSKPSDYEDALAFGSTILSVRQMRQMGPEAILETIPAGANYYITYDIDGFDPSIAPGTGIPSHGGLLFYEVLDIVKGLARRGNVVGMDVVEVAPCYDNPSGITAYLAAQILFFTLGYIFAARQKR